jgi:hypothetical protein
VNNDANQCGAVVNYPASTTTSACGTVTCSPASGSFFPKGTTTVTCTTTAGPVCTFTITVNDTQAPTLVCPANVTAVAAGCAGTSQLVTYVTPTASDNCPGVTVVCSPASGTIFPVGTTTVTCTATDTAGNTATCSFTLTTFNACIQDDANPGTVLLWNTQTGAYRFCCNGVTYTGIGTVKNKGSVHTIDHIAADRRVSGKVDCSTNRGEGGLQSGSGSLIGWISDRNVTNNSCSCGVAPLQAK